MLETENLDLFHYLTSPELYFHTISHSFSKHELSQSESTDKEVDILPSKTNLATANPRLVSRGHVSIMVYGEGGDFDEVITEWEPTTGWEGHAELDIILL